MLVFATTLLINEFLFDPPGSDSGQEWVEVVNAGSESVDVGGWHLERAKSSWSVRAVLPEGVWLAPGQRVVVGDAGSGAQLEVAGSLDLGNGSSSGDALRLVSSAGEIVDMVVYGPNNDDGFTQISGGLAWPVPVSGGLLARLPDAQSTGSPADWSSSVAPSPGLPNVATPCEVASVTLNELLVDPEGADGSLEWVELHAAESVDLDGWAIEASTRAGRVVQVYRFDSVVIAGGEVLLIDGLSGLPNGSGGDAVRLVDCEGAVQDVVVYGASNEDGLLDATGALAQPVLLGSSGQSLARREDGVHSGVLSEDWWVPEHISPGEPNPSPASCEAQGSLRISEVYPDPPGADDPREEFVELVNTGQDASSLTGWQLRIWTTASDSTTLSLPAGVVVAPGAVVVVGQEWAVDVPLELPNGRGGDALWLEDCTGRAVDTVAWGESNTDEVPTPVGGVASLEPAPGSGRSLAWQAAPSPEAVGQWRVGEPTPGVLDGSPQTTADRLAQVQPASCASTGPSPVFSWGWGAVLGPVLWRRRRRTQRPEKSAVKHRLAVVLQCLVSRWLARGEV